MRASKSSISTTEPAPIEKEANSMAIEKPLYSLPLLNLRQGRAAVLAYFENTWNLTEQLFSALVSEEAYYVRPYHKTRHPLIFYYAHPVCFYVNKLLVSGLIDSPVNKEFELLFETGVDEMTWDDLHDGEQDIWPSLTEVKVYRRAVFDMVKTLIETHPLLDQEITIEKPTWALAMAFEHERIHLETSSVLIRELPVEYLREPDSWPPSLASPASQEYAPEVGFDYPRNAMIEMSPSTVKLGKPKQWPSFGWDNEYGREERQVASFSASKFLVSNGEFFEFVTAGGYEQEKYWTEGAWSWRRFRNVKWPTFWVQDGPAGSHRFKLRTTFEEIPMQWNWPAIVNYFEAKAYCAWLTEREGGNLPIRLLQEAEHLAIRDPALDSVPDSATELAQALTLDQVMNEAERFAVNHNLRFGSESPVDGLSPNGRGFHDSFGNVWQWCEDTFHPLAEFAIHPYYSDFSTPCFDDEHQMILGGSFISTGDEASIWSRFHFRPHFFQHAGFRIAQDVDSPAKKGDKYDTDEVVNQYLLFHFGSEAEQSDQALAARIDFPLVTSLIERTVELMGKYSVGKSRALDLGCAVGRSSFEMSRDFDEVLGLDYSEAFIDAANTLKERGELAYRRWETGRHVSELSARLDPKLESSRVTFLQGDAANLKSIDEVWSRGGFDAILLSNLLCRLSDPAKCLSQFVATDSLLGSGGILVIASPNTWLNQFTQRESFLDGADSAETLAAIASCLPGFEMLHEEDVPFMIREHRRKYEYIISQVSVWQKQ